MSTPICPKLPESVMCLTRYKPKTSGENPTIVEYGYQFVRNDMGEGIIGHGFKKHVPFLATMFFFILVSNFVGLIG